MEIVNNEVLRAEILIFELIILKRKPIMWYQRIAATTTELLVSTVCIHEATYVAIPHAAAVVLAHNLILNWCYSAGSDDVIWKTFGRL